MKVMDSAGATGVRWDLGAIYATEAEADSDRLAAVSVAKDFETAYRGKVKGLTGAELAEALDAYCRAITVAHRLSSFSQLRQAVDTESAEYRDFANAVSDVVREVTDSTRFFELEAESLGEAELARRAASPELARYRHHLERLAVEASHRLTEPEERALAARNPAAVAAWEQLFASTLATVTVTVPREGDENAAPLTLDGALSLLFNSDRALRHRAMDAVYASLEPRAEILARCYDSRVADRLVSDRLLRYETPMRAANEANDLADAVVLSLIDSVEEQYPLAQRWFRAKATRLGLKRLDLADQYAPQGADREISFDEACELTHHAVGEFSEELWQILSLAIEEHRIDAEPRGGKRGGAFCHPVSFDRPAYILLNYSGGLSSARTLAHEGGHLIHMTLAKQRQTAVTYETGMAMAEIASTFNEMLLFDHQMATEKDPEVRTAIVASRIESSFSTVFRQTVLARYEQGAYALRQQQLSLTPERLSEIWLRCNALYYGDSVELPPGYRFGWSYIPHFIATRFYTYSYAFAHLASLVLYARYREQGKEFVPRYVDFLAAGGSQSPADLLASMDIDISTADWVDDGFSEMQRMIDVAAG